MSSHSYLGASNSNMSQSPHWTCVTCAQQQGGAASKQWKASRKTGSRTTFIHHHRMEHWSYDEFEEWEVSDVRFEFEDAIADAIAKDDASAILEACRVADDRHPKWLKRYVPCNPDCQRTSRPLRDAAYACHPNALSALLNYMENMNTDCFAEDDPDLFHSPPSLHWVLERVKLQSQSSDEQKPETKRAKVHHPTAQDPMMKTMTLLLEAGSSTQTRRGNKTVWEAARDLIDHDERPFALIQQWACNGCMAPVGKPPPGQPMGRYCRECVQKYCPEYCPVPPPGQMGTRWPCSLTHWREHALKGSSLDFNQWFCLSCFPDMESRIPDFKKAPKGTVPPQDHCRHCRTMLACGAYVCKELNVVLCSDCETMLQDWLSEARKGGFPYAFFKETRKAQSIRSKLPRDVTTPCKLAEYFRWRGFEEKDVFPKCARCDSYVRKWVATTEPYCDDGCRYPPCARCGEKQRQRHSEYTYKNNPRWTCDECNFIEKVNDFKTWRAANSSRRPAKGGNVEEHQWWKFCQNIRDRGNAWQKQQIKDALS